MHAIDLDAVPHLDVRREFGTRDVILTADPDADPYAPVPYAPVQRGIV